MRFFPADAMIAPLALKRRNHCKAHYCVDIANAYIALSVSAASGQKYRNLEKASLVWLPAIALLPARRGAMPIASLRRYACGGDARNYFLRRLRNRRRKLRYRRKGPPVFATQYRRKA